MRRTRCRTLAFLVIMGLAVPASAQRPAYDPLAVYIYQVPPSQALATLGKYCVTDPTRTPLEGLPSGVCTFDDVDSCVRAARARDVLWSQMYRNAECRPNMHYRP
jgi:hypothetical protein